MVERLGDRNTDRLCSLCVFSGEVGRRREGAGEDAVAVLVLDGRIDGERAVGAARDDDAELAGKGDEALLDEVGAADLGDCGR